MPFLSLDIDYVLDFNVPYLQQLKFALIMALPAVFMLFYNALGSINKDRWIDRYITRWIQVRSKGWAIYGCFLLLTVIAGFAYDISSVSRVAKLDWPAPRTNGVILLGVSVFTSLFLLWLVLARIFRSHRLNDHSPNHAQFFEWWLARIFWLRKISLFVLTIIFMPVSRVILSQFQCFCEEDPWVESAPQCHIIYFPDQQCLPLEWSVLQGCAIFFGFAYIIGTACVQLELKILR